LLQDDVRHDVTVRCGQIGIHLRPQPGCLVIGTTDELEPDGSSDVEGVQPRFVAETDQRQTADPDSCEMPERPAVLLTTLVDTRRTLASQRDHPSA
jgi:hypothetical protein